MDKIYNKWYFHIYIVWQCMVSKYEQKSAQKMTSFGRKKMTQKQMLKWHQFNYQNTTAFKLDTMCLSMLSEISKTYGVTDPWNFKALQLLIANSYVPACNKLLTIIKNANQKRTSHVSLLSFENKCTWVQNPHRYMHAWLMHDSCTCI